MEMFKVEDNEDVIDILYYDREKCCKEERFDPGKVSTSLINLEALKATIDPAWRTAYKSIARVLLSFYHPASETIEIF
jgi:hypothetical protein